MLIPKGAAITQALRGYTACNAKVWMRISELFPIANSMIQCCLDVFWPKLHGEALSGCRGQRDFFSFRWFEMVFK